MQHILLELIFVLHFVVIFGQLSYWKMLVFFHPLEDQILWHELFELLEIITEKQLVEKKSSKKTVQKGEL